MEVSVLVLGIEHLTLLNESPSEPVSEIPGALKVPATEPEQSEDLWKLYASARFICDRKVSHRWGKKKQTLTRIHYKTHLNQQ